ncbi:flagellar basal body-associated FliL family protein [Methylopila sp. M107]|uniref:flagellar basal body-associated FliL family protein n=1 Tax=Methylopila sp. M107 TaxID=1101190 RepID=UPI00037DD243|nr:flagellar basal body-associated FliL family protein [Methylopila sp. M107]
MANTEGEDGAAKPAPKSKKKLIIIGAAAAVAILGGAGGYFALAGGKGEKGGHGEAAAHGEEKGGHGEAAAAADGHGGEAQSSKAYVDLPEMTVNLSTVEREKQRYVRLNVALEVDKPEMAAAIKPMMPRVLDSFQTHLRELRPDDIRGSSGAYRLKEELLRRVNTAVSPAKVDAVLFKEIVVQ